MLFSHEHGAEVPVHLRRIVLGKGVGGGAGLIGVPNLALVQEVHGADVHLHLAIFYELLHVRVGFFGQVGTVVAGEVFVNVHGFGLVGLVGNQLHCRTVNLAIKGGGFVICFSKFFFLRLIAGNNHVGDDRNSYEHDSDNGPDEPGTILVGTLDFGSFCGLGTHVFFHLLLGLRG